MRLDRNVWRVALARFVSRVGGEAAFFVGIWGTAVFDFEATPGQVAALMAVLGGVALASGAVAGMLVDRYDPRRVLIVGEILFVPAALSATLATNMTELTWAVGAMGLFSTPVFTAITSFAPYLTDDQGRLGRINSVVESAGMAAFVAGPAVGALIAHVASLAWIFVLDAATSLAAVLLVLAVRVRDVERSPRGTGGALVEIREGFVHSYASRHLRYFILALTSVWLVFGAFGTLEAIFYREVLGAGPSVLGLVNALFGLGLVAGSTSVGRLPGFFRSARGIASVVALNGLGAMFYTGTNRLAVVVSGGIFWGLVIGVMVTAGRTLIHQHSPEPLIGRISATVLFHNEVAALLPLAVIPSLATLFGVQPVLVGSGLVLMLLGAIAWPTATSLDRLSAGPAPPAQLPIPIEEPRSHVP